MVLDRAKVLVLIAALFLCALYVAAAPAQAGAMTLRTSSPNVLDSADFTLQMLSTDDTGTAILVVDGKPMASRIATPGAVISFGTFKFAPGTRSAVALVRSRNGVARSAPMSVRVWGLPGTPQLVSPTPGGYAAKYVAGAIRPGLSTTLVHVYLNGRFFKTTTVYSGSLQNIGTMTLATGLNTIDLVAVNPVATTKATYKVNRLDYPWSTCIIIDKSDCKMYWVRDGVLVKVYPIAVGKRSTQTPVGTWKIGAKYITGPVGIYGPRKMRMYRLTSSGYVFTAYNIHGTNQEWVIGTWASHGCIRMYNRDVLELYPQVPLGTMVQTRE